MMLTMYAAVEDVFISFTEVLLITHCVLYSITTQSHALETIPITAQIL